MMRVVIVDDEMITRTSLKDFICSQLSDYEVAGTFSNGQEALDWMRTHSADIVITDIRMPEMDGLELSPDHPGILSDHHGDHYQRLQ